MAVNVLYSSLRIRVIVIQHPPPLLIHSCSCLLHIHALPPILLIHAHRPPLLINTCLPLSSFAPALSFSSFTFALSFLSTPTRCLSVYTCFLLFHGALLSYLYIPMLIITNTSNILPCTSVTHRLLNVILELRHLHKSTQRAHFTCSRCHYHTNTTLHSLPLSCNHTTTNTPSP